MKNLWTAVVLMGCLSQVSMADPPDATAKMRGGSRADVPSRRTVGQGQIYRPTVGTAPRAIIARAPSSNAAERSYSHDPSLTATAPPQVLRHFSPSSNDSQATFRPMNVKPDLPSTAAPRGADSKMKGNY